MIKLERPKHVFTDNWSVLLKAINIHKRVNILLSTVVVILLGTLIVKDLEPPLVITIDQAEKTNYYYSKRKEITITDRDINSKLQSFIHARYKWDNLNPKDISERLDGIVTKDLILSTYKYLSLLKKKDFKDKKLAQDISHLKVIIQKNKIEAYFDKVLRINNIPLIIPTKLSFRLKVGSKTKINPMGLYIYKVHETTGVHK